MDAMPLCNWGTWEALPTCARCYCSGHGTPPSQRADFPWAPIDAAAGFPKVIFLWNHRILMRGGRFRRKFDTYTKDTSHRMEQTRTFEFLARAYAQSQRETGVVSVARAARAIATLLPECEFAGRRLDEEIARCALAEDRSVAFDRGDIG